MTNILFGVDDKEVKEDENLKTILDNVDVKGVEDNLQRDGYHHIPSVQQGLGIDKICSFR